MILCIIIVIIRCLLLFYLWVSRLVWFTRWVTVFVFHLVLDRPWFIHFYQFMKKLNTIMRKHIDSSSFRTRQHPNQDDVFMFKKIYFIILWWALLKSNVLLQTHILNLSGRNTFLIMPSCFENKKKIYSHRTVFS